MTKYVATWAHALHLSDNLRHANVNFKLYVDNNGRVIFVFNDADATQAAKMCAGLAKKI
jgi:hypothetical protein